MKNFIIILLFTSLSCFSQPITVTLNQVNNSPGDYVARERVNILPPFSFTANNNKLVARIGTYNNDFKIGIFNSLTNVNLWDYPDPDVIINNSINLTINNDGYPTSPLNVLKEDGFNIVTFWYNPNEWSSINSIKKSLLFAQQNGFQVELNGAGYFKPNYAKGDFPINDGGINIYDNCGNYFSNDNDYPQCQNYFRPNIDNFLNKVYSQSPYKDIIWGYHMCEEAAFFHGSLYSDNCLTGPGYYSANGWCDIDGRKDILQNHTPPITNVDWGYACYNDYFVSCEVPPANVESAISYYKNYLNNKGINNHKYIVMEASHSGQISPITQCPEDFYHNNQLASTSGRYEPQDYVYLLHKNANEVFFEGSYGIPFYDEENNDGALLFRKSIDFAKTYTNEVHKVISSDFRTDLHTLNTSVLNANYMWYQAYSSIIHGATGIWFYNLTDAFIANAFDLNIPEKFTKANFPIHYKNFISNLSKELRYLVNQNLICTDSRTTVSTTYDYLKYFDVTIRSNNNKTIAIIVNNSFAPQNFFMNFSAYNDPLIQGSNGAYELFNNASYQYDASTYKTNRDSYINLASNNVGKKIHHDFISGGGLQLVLGPLDVMVLQFDNAGFTKNSEDYASDDNQLIDTSLSILSNNETNNVSEFKLYPNPCNDNIYLEAINCNTYENIYFNVYSLIGQLLLTENISTNLNKINISILNPGAYIYKIVSNNHILKTDNLLIIR